MTLIKLMTNRSEDVVVTFDVKHNFLSHDHCHHSQVLDNCKAAFCVNDIMLQTILHLEMNITSFRFPSIWELSIISPVMVMVTSMKKHVIKCKTVNVMYCFNLIFIHTVDQGHYMKTNNINNEL